MFRSIRLGARRPPEQPQYSSPNNPRGWYAVAPLHSCVFCGMLLGIQREAFQIAAISTEAAGEFGHG